MYLFRPTHNTVVVVVSPRRRPTRSPSSRRQYAQIPLLWFDLACERTPTVRALRVGCYLWHLAGRLRTLEGLWVSSNTIAVRMGGSPKAAQRGIQDLAQAGLLTAKIRPRHGAVVTLPGEAALRALEREWPPWV